ncbi:MAG: ABC transporter ATP-binding protein/permease [Planctomycetes bacterium]|nr:ABC transporter ATP-binding protein/permease [Planctomycetota bacterium]
MTHTQHTTNSVLVPGVLIGCLDQAGLLHRNLWLANFTDVSLRGEPAQEWLVVSRQEISVLDRGTSPTSEPKTAEGSPREPSAKLLRTIPWQDVKSVRTQSGVGSGTLQVRIGDDWIDLVRFSNAFATRFHKISRLMEKMREFPETWSEDLYAQSTDPHANTQGFDAPQCPKCSLYLTSKEESCPRCMQKGQILRRVHQLLRPYRRGAILLCLLTIAGVIAELIPPKLQQYMIDHVLTGSSHSNEARDVDFRTALLLIVLALAASRVLLSFVGVFKGKLATIIGTGLTRTLRAEMVRKLQSLAIVYYDRHQVGSMLGRVAHDSEAMHGLMYQITGGFLLQIAQLIGVGAMLVWINPKLALFTLIPVPLVILGTSIFWKKVYPRYYRLWDASSKQISVLSGMLTGIRVVKAFSQEEKEYERFSKTSEQLRDWRLWVENANAWYSAAMSIVFSLGGLIVWYVGGRDVIGNSMSLGELIAFLAYLGMFYAPLSALSNFTSWLTSFLTGSKRVLELLDTPLTVLEPKNPASWESARGEIRFEEVTFGYDRNQPVLKNVSFEVQAGEMVGIVGRSGSGKSTMVNLLGRFYDVQEGRILVDGIDLRDVSSQQLRERLGIVFQESYMFRGTIWRNLSFGKPEATVQQGLAAAKAAGAHDFICRQQLGYETLLGENGSGLSGGEKQRLSIARTLLYDPKILVLDEATSNIDAEAEKSIQEALKVLIRGRTTLAIAHRLSTLRNADRIIVFDQGRLIEQGTHAELLALDGTYARLVRIQTSVSKNPDVDKLIHTAAEMEKEQLSSSNSKRSKSDRSLSVSSQSTKSRDRSDVGVLERSKDNTGNEDSETSDSLDQDDSSDTDPIQVDDQAQVDQEASTAPAIRWLEDQECEFRRGLHDRIELWSEGKLLAASVFVVKTFPSKYPEGYLSVRSWKDNGEEFECGMIKDLKSWSIENCKFVRELIERRYLLRKIQRVRKNQLESGYLNLEVETDRGPCQFTMRWTQGQALDYSENGKLLIDTCENRYVVEDIDALHAEDRERFLQYIYW